jgi:hypothetical protein
VFSGKLARLVGIRDHTARKTQALAGTLHGVHVVLAPAAEPYYCGVEHLDLFNPRNNISRG